MMRLACTLAAIAGLVWANPALSEKPDDYGDADETVAFDSNSGGCASQTYGGRTVNGGTLRSNDTTQFGVELRSGQVFENNDDTTFLNFLPTGICPPQSGQGKQIEFLHPYLVSPYYVSPYLVSPYYVSPYLVSPYFVSPYLVSPYFVSPYLVSPYLVSPYFVSPYLVSPYLVSPYFGG